jgi:hypothetical protein
MQCFELLELMPEEKLPEIYAFLLGASFLGISGAAIEIDADLEYRSLESETRVSVRPGINWRAASMAPPARNLFALQYDLEPSADDPE